MFPIRLLRLVLLFCLTFYCSACIFSSVGEFPLPTALQLSVSHHCVLLQLSATRSEVVQLQEKCKEQVELIDRLKAELQDTMDEYSTLSYQTRTVINQSVSHHYFLY